MKTVITDTNIQEIKQIIDAHPTLETVTQMNDLCNAILEGEDLSVSEENVAEILAVQDLVQLKIQEIISNK